MSWDTATQSGKALLAAIDQMVQYTREDLDRYKEDGLMHWNAKGALWAFEASRRMVAELLPHAELDATERPEVVADSVKAWRASREA